jgi:Na+/phosphate symporter
MPKKTNRNHQVLRQSQIAILSIGFNTIALWLGGDLTRPASAAPLYGTLTNYLKTAATGFCLAGGLDAKGTASITSLIELIPWSAILLIGSIIAWEAYGGYQAYQREDATGMGRSAVNLVITVALTLLTNLITAYLTTAPGSP